MKTASKTTGLRYWMLRVLAECDCVAADFSADPVHDLRVSLRRCRSMADGMMAMDPDPNWKAMKKAGKQLFQRLGALRDVQVMMDWIDKLHPSVVTTRSLQASTGGTPALPPASQDSQNSADPASAKTVAPDRIDPVAHALLQLLKARETEHKREARAALEEFDRKQWRQWTKSLPVRAARIRPGSAVFKHLALERWTAARELHTRAMRNRSRVAFHTLRIGIKRFRYIVENFLPNEHKAWSDDLKHLQDLLGEVHDLDVLWATAQSCHVFADKAFSHEASPGEEFEDEDSREAWHARILKERNQRIDEYRHKTTGPDSLWSVWRAGLPQGKQVERIATSRIKLWAKVLDPDFVHSERVARLALQLYDGLVPTGLLAPSRPVASLKSALTEAESQGTSNGDEAEDRASLYAAALLHDIGKSKGNKGHHKESLEIIKKHGAPLGWRDQTMQRAAIVARFHCGALPTRSHKTLRNLLPGEQRTIIRLAAMLRLANALDAAHDGHIRRVKIENGFFPKNQKRVNGFRRRHAALGKNEALVIAAEGYLPGSPTAQTVAAERHLLETVLRRPVVVRPMKATAS